MSGYQELVRALDYVRYMLDAFVFYDRAYRELGVVLSVAGPVGTSVALELLSDGGEGRGTDDAVYDTTVHGLGTHH
jgi:hypothetical protein